MIKRQMRTIVICAVAFAALITVYFAVVKPLLFEKEDEGEQFELIEGEVRGSNNRVMMFEHVEKADMASIEVHNQYGSFTFYRGNDDNFLIKGMEGAPYSLEMLSSLVVSTGYTLAMPMTDGSPRLSDPEADLSVYGLAESDDPAWFVVTKINGVTHKVYVGDPILTGGGYYCRYDGRDAVYVLDTTLTSTVLADIMSLVTPTLAYPISQNEYMSVDDFRIVRDGKLFLWIDMIPPTESGSDNMSYDVKYPENHNLNLSLYSKFLQVLSSFAGTKTVFCEGSEHPLTPEILGNYGIDIENPHYLISYKCGDVESDTAFSKPDDDGMIYAYSTLYGLIARIDPSTDSGKAALSIMSVGINDFADPALFAKNINDVSRIEIKGNIDSDGEKLSVDAYFTLEGEKEDIVIRQNGSAREYDADSVKNFRQLYRTILGVKREDTADMTDTDKMALLAELTVETDDGERAEYKFYSYSTRRCFYTVNGSGEFYVLRDSVEKIIRDTDRMLKGLPIDSDGRN